MREMIKKIVVKQLAVVAKKIIVKNPELEVIGITGSAGKSSTKEAIFHVLSKSQRFEGGVKKSAGNLNTEFGLPLVILGYEKSPAVWQWPFLTVQAIFRSSFSNPLEKVKILILEYSADHKGDIKKLCDIVKPKIGVITSIGAAHTEFFKTVDNVAQEKGYLAEVLPQKGVLFLGENNKFKEEIVKRTSAQIKYFNDNSIEPHKEIAQEVGRYLGIPKKEIDESLNNFINLPGRLNIFRGKKDTTLIDDTYNANPLSMKKGLKYLHDYKVKENKIAILGDMRELGDLAEKEHEKLAEEIIKYSDKAILIGPNMQKFTAPVLKKKCFPYYAFLNFSEARGKILSEIGSGDTILIKGSQNTLFLERITEMLLLNPQEKNKLCRRGIHWDEIRAKTK